MGKAPLGHCARPTDAGEPFRARSSLSRRPSLRSGQAFSVRTHLNSTIAISPRDL